MEKISPERYAIELIVAGLMGALVKSKAVTANVLEDHVTVPLYNRFRLHGSYAEKSANDDDRRWHRSVEVECGQWHSYLESVIRGLK